MQVTEQDQRAYIMMSAAGNVPVVNVIRFLKRILKKNAYTDNHIRRLYGEFKRKERLSSTDQRCENSGQNTVVNEEYSHWLDQLMMERRDWTLNELALEMGISSSSISRLLEKGGYRKVRARWLPHDLTAAEMRQRVQAATDNVAWFTRDPGMLERIIAIDETIMRCFTPPDPDMASEWRRAGEGPPARYHTELSDWSRMLILAVRQGQIIAWDFLDSDETMDRWRYIQFLNESIRPWAEEHLSPSGHHPIIEHDNARSHVARDTQIFLRRRGWDSLSHPPYS